MKLAESPRLPKDVDGPVFAEPWEAQAFAMAVKLNEAGVFSWSEWAETLGAELKAQPERPYYESWLAALERLVEAKGVMSRRRAPGPRRGLGPCREGHAPRPAHHAQPSLSSHGNCSISQ